jgi:hypothetical protein
MDALESMDALTKTRASMINRASMDQRELFRPNSDALPDDVARGLVMLAASPPLWPVPLAQWLSVVDNVRAFAERWDGQSRACGWSTLLFYGLHRRAPYARLQAMGAAWLLATSRHRAIAVDASAIELRSTTGAQLRIYLPVVEPEAVPAWSLYQRP